MPCEPLSQSGNQYEYAAHCLSFENLFPNQAESGKKFEYGYIYVCISQKMIHNTDF